MQYREMETQSEDTNFASASYHQHSECPNCGDHSLSHSDDCLSAVLDEHTVLDTANTPGVPGKYCSSDGCSWFKLDRSDNAAEEQNPKSDIDNNFNTRVKISEGCSISIFHRKVNLHGDTATYLKENECPECASDVVLKLKRVKKNTEQDHLPVVEEYHPVSEKCVNYGKTGDACDYHE